MSLKNCKEVKKNRYELEIEIDKEKFGKALNEVMRRESAKLNIPGFRKGKAPLSIVEKYYGAEAFFEEALNELFGEEVDAAAKEANLEIVDDKMDFDLVSISKENGADFKVTLTVVPDIEIGEYKGLTAEKAAVEVTDQEIDETVKNIAERNARMVAVEDRPAEKDDIAVIDYEGFVDGKAFEGGKGESYSLTLGSNQFIPGFEDQVIGHNSGDEFDVNVSFPEDYHAKELAGKAAVFHCKLHEIKKRELPVIDDEFAKDVSEFDTLAEYKADLKAKTLERKQKAADDEAETALLEQIIDSIQGEIPEAMYENRVKQDVQDFGYRLSMQGLSLESYMKATGMKMEDFSKTFRPQAEKQVKMRLALEKIVKLENLTASDEEVADYYAKMAKDYSVSEDQVKAAVPAEEIKKDLAVQKALELVKSTAKFTVAAKDEKKPAAAKKPAAKKADDTAEKKTPAKKTTAAKKPAAKKPAAKKTTAAKKTAEKKAEE